MKLVGTARRGTALVAALAALSVPALASANGRYPAAGQIALDPADPSVILVRATYGLLLSKNVGQRWDWICEGAVGSNGFEDPMMSFMADGSLIAGIFEGLSVSHDNGCGWAFAQGGLTNKYVIDLSVERGAPAKGVLIISNSVGQDDAGQPAFLTQLWETSDNAVTWTQAGVSLPSALLGLTVDTAPSDRNRVYVSGRLGAPGYQGVLERSDDRGATWQPMVIPGSDDTHLPYIGAIDPMNPDVVYVRLDGDPTDQLVVTKDGGVTWTPAYTTVGNMAGLALSPDGATIALGGDKDGLWTAPTSTLQFTKASKVGALCLTWTPAGLYACADEFVDTFTAGVSTDQGKTFTPLMHLQQLCGPLLCSASSPVTTQCVSQWPATAATIGAVSCDGTGGGASAGSTSASSSSSSGGGSSGGGGGCAYAPSGAGLASLASSALLGLAALSARRRARRGRPRHLKM